MLKRCNERGVLRRDDPALWKRALSHCPRYPCRDKKWILMRLFLPGCMFMSADHAENEYCSLEGMGNAVKVLSGVIARLEKT